MKKFNIFVRYHGCNIGYKDGTRQIIQDQLINHFGKIQNMLLVMWRNQQERNSKRNL